MSARPSRSRGLLAWVGVLAGLGLVVAPILAIPAAQAYDEDAIVQLVNEQRWADGSDGLIHNADMDAVALAWAQQMAAANTLSHNPNYASQIPRGWSRAAENVAQGYSSAASVMDGWMNSSGHRANILGDYTDIGVALIEGGGTTWAVQVFGKYAGHEGPAAPAAAEPAQPAQPATPAPVDPAPTESTSSAPVPSATPTPAPVPTPSASKTSGPAFDSSVNREAGGPSPLLVIATVLGIGALLIAGLSVWLGVRRRRLRSRDENWSAPVERRSLDG